MKGDLRLFEITEPKEQWHNVDRQRISSIKFDPFNNNIFAVSGTEGVKIYDLRKSEKIISFLPDREVKKIDWCPDFSNSLATLSVDPISNQQKVEFWNIGGFNAEQDTELEAWFISETSYGESVRGFAWRTSSSSNSSKYAVCTKNHILEETYVAKDESPIEFTNDGTLLFSSADSFYQYEMLPRRLLQRINEDY